MKTVYVFQLFTHDKYLNGRFLRRCSQPTSNSVIYVKMRRTQTLSNFISQSMHNDA